MCFKKVRSGEEEVKGQRCRKDLRDQIGRRKEQLFVRLSYFWKQREHVGFYMKLYILLMYN